MEKYFALLGAIVNCVSVVLGSAVGLIIYNVTKGKGLSNKGKRISDTVYAALALCVLLIGLGGALKGAVNGQIADSVAPDSLLRTIFGEQTIVIILSMVFGAIIGEIANLDRLMNRLGEKLQTLLKGRGGNVANGFVSGSLLFCVGSMAVVGAMNSGTTGDHSMQYAKSALDLVSAIILSSTMGIGVMFSAAFVLLYQGSITVLAQLLGGFLGDEVILCMTSTGSLLIIALSLNMLGLTKIKVMNLLPAMILPVILLPIYDFAVGLIR